MISHLDGTVHSVAPDGAVIDIGGVGMSVRCTPATVARMRQGDRTRVPTSLIVREDALTLYGFADDDERAVFEVLQTAGGIGPRLALAMLAVHSPDALRQAVAAEDLGALTLVPGIGKKGAQRIVLELKDRLGPARSGRDGDGTGADGSGRVTPAAASGSWRAHVHAGLTGLGWPARDAQQAVDAVAPEMTALAAQSADGQTVDVAVALRAALRTLSRR